MALSRNEIEGILCDIWEDLLAIEVGPDDDFFEIGGYSLLIVTVVAECRKHGLELSANDVYDYKTPSGIADALSAAALAATKGRDLDFGAVWAEGTSLRQGATARTLVPFTEDGVGTPVFCFPWGTGNVRFIGRFVDSFRAGRPAYGLEAVGVSSRERPLLSVSELAARFLREIRAVQPRGPYLFVGTCAGGRIAYEAARQLEEIGEQVAVLAVVNGMPPAGTELDPGWGLRELYEFRLAHLRTLYEVPDLLTRQEDILEAMSKAGYIDEGMDPADLYWRQVVWSAYMFSNEHYEPGPYGGELTVFQLQRYVGSEPWDWSRYAHVETHTFDLPRTMALLGNADFAAKLEAKLAAFDG